jgi:hypothetical protein
LPDGFRLKTGLPDFTTCFAETDVSTAVPASTGVDESLGDSFAHQKSAISGDVTSACSKVSFDDTAWCLTVPMF